MKLTYEIKEEILEEFDTDRKTIYGGFYKESRVVGYKWRKAEWKDATQKDLAFAQEQVRLGKARNLKVLK